ncbi:MAG: DinB family protein [Caulobacterales bacterium]|nr:DinB family protein [Caulobacterales bacterium]
MTPTPYVQLIDVKRWADRGLCEAAAQTIEQLSAQEASIMVRILDHIHVVDRIFRHHLQGSTHGFQAARSDVLPELRPLIESLQETDDWYASYVRSLSAKEVAQAVDFTFTSGKPARMTRGEILLHVCLHGTYHRGNAGAVLQLKGLTPSRDSITDFLEDAA